MTVSEASVIRQYLKASGFTLGEIIAFTQSLSYDEKQTLIMVAEEAGYKPEKVYGIFGNQEEA